jgi:uncharacterized glyoxalase superfamily protein PhnB
VKEEIFNPRYVLAVIDLEKSVNYYETELGFKMANRYPGWAFLSRGAFVIMLGECPEEKPASAIGDHSYFAYLEVMDAKSLFDEYEKKNVELIKPLKDEPWGMREFGIRTIDGHRIMFGQNLDNVSRT